MTLQTDLFHATLIQTKPEAKGLLLPRKYEIQGVQKK